MLKMSSLPFPFLLIVKGSVEKWPGFLEPYHSRSHAFHPVIQNCLEKRRYDFKLTDPIFENAWNLDSPFAGKDHITCRGSLEHRLDSKSTLGQGYVIVPRRVEAGQTIFF